MSFSIRLMAAALVLAAPVSLRYHFKPGQTLRYLITEHAETSIQAGTQKAVLVQKQDTTTTVDRRVLSVSAGSGVVEERRQEGETKTTKPDGMASTLVEPSVQVLTLTARGVITKSERRALPGTRKRGPQFLDGLAFALPAKPVALNAAWSGTTNAIGPDGKPMPVRYTSHYAGSVSKAGHPCAQIVTDYSARFRISGSGPATPTDGALSGQYTAYLAQDLGQEAAAEGKLTLAFKSTVKGADGKPVNVVRTVQLLIAQTLVK
jgi:hypothetical protein